MEIEALGCTASVHDFDFFERLKFIPRLVFRSAEMFQLFTYTHVHKDFASHLEILPEECRSVSGLCSTKP